MMEKKETKKRKDVEVKAPVTTIVVKADPKRKK